MYVDFVGNMVPQERTSVVSQATRIQCLSLTDSVSDMGINGY
jgi:hypothetical protein